MEQTNPTEMVIERSLWARGGEDDTQLLNGNGKMCCLGFYARACGYKPDEILELSCPSDLSLNGMPPAYQWLRQQGIWPRESSDGSILMATNDDEDFSDKERERHISEVFAKHNVAVTFKD